jgi:hypothetical protein
MKPTDNRTSFLQLSEALTGIAIDSFNTGTGAPAKPGDLDPHNSPIDLAVQYLETLENELPAETIQGLLQEFTTRQGSEVDYAKTADAITYLLKDPVCGPICRSIMKLWFLGIWYSPVNPSVPVRVISTQAYKEALVWKVARAHPMGYSMWSFGYWHDVPPAREAFLSFYYP